MSGSTKLISMCQLPRRLTELKHHQHLQVAVPTASLTVIIISWHLLHQLYVLLHKHRPHPNISDRRYYGLTPSCICMVAGSRPCTCDFCHMGKTIPSSIYKQNQQATRGLDLRRGPDPRFYNPMKAQLSQLMRGLTGMDR